MKNNEPLEDFEDIQEIKRQKEEQKQLNEEMANWEFGRGIMPSKEEKQDVRN